MGFATSWLETESLFPQLIKEVPDKGTCIIVVVPAFNEPDIHPLLDSLAACSKPSCGVEVLIIINAPPGAEESILRNNSKTLKDSEFWKRNNQGTFFRLYPIDTGQPLIRQWGVGLARKTGMDEALRRFDYIGRPCGIIVNLDADCQVKDNYFTDIEKEFLYKPERQACSVYFEHPISGSEYPEVIYRSIVQYELHLRYYYQALKFSGFPNVFHTVGSATAVRASAYVKAGGMNRRRAAEDFYFVQKLVALGGYFNLMSTTVYPSPRISDRVPFGTGKSIGRISSCDEIHFMTYNPLSFKDLSVFFDLVCKTAENDVNRTTGLFSLFPVSISSFLGEEEWISKIEEIRQNTASPQSFRKRFFNWFNMFRIVKFLNHAHNSIYKKVAADYAAEELLRYLGKINIPGKSADLLEYFRRLEKEN